MKKTLSIILVAVMLITVLTTAAFAVNYERPFYSGALDSKTYRIPAIYTLNNGSVIALADKRYEEGLDSPANIDVVYGISQDGYTGWQYGTLNRFDDYADNANDKQSASFIDSAIVQSSTGRIFVVSDAFPSGGGYLQAKRGTGFVEVDGVNRMLLTTGNTSDSLNTFEYYIGASDGELAAVYTLNGNVVTEYSVDAEYNLYKNGEALYMAQKGSEGVSVRQNVFYNDAELCCYMTTYLWLRYSDDNGVTWSAPINLSAFVKESDESFLGISPGRGFIANVDGTERIIFNVYDNCGGRENVSTVYSDDNGATWHRGEETVIKLGVGKTSESQIVELNDGVLRMFGRNTSDFVSYADSTDGGITWSTFSADLDLTANGNCMSSFINTSKVIDGKKVVLGSYPSNSSERADGVVRVGLVNDNNDIDWITTYYINDGFYAYSCLTELSDGNFALLYEDEPYNINYMILTIDGDGNLSEINGNNIEAPEKSFWENVVAFFNSIITWFMELFDII